MTEKKQEISPLSLYLFDKLLPGVKRVYIPFIVALAICVVSMIVRLYYAENIPSHIQVIMFFTQFTFIITLWNFLKFVNRMFDKIWPYSSKPILRFFSQLFVSFAGYASIRSLVFFLFIDYLPLKDQDTFKSVALALDFLFAVAVNIGFLAYYFLNQWRDSWMQAQQLEKENTQVQYDNLKNQLNPHFLFNSLTSLQSLIMKDQELATRFLQQLSKVYRYLLENRMKETVSLKREIDFVQHYVELLSTRFGKSFQCMIQVPEEYHEAQVVPVSLQIMIENAIKHNTLALDAPLKIDILTDQNHLVIRNNLQKRESVETSNKMGLDNFRKLYSFLSEEPVHWETKDEYFYVRIPLL